MKNKNLGKAAGISLILGLMLTGCSNAEPAPTNTAPAATASASAKPIAEPTKTAKPVDELTDIKALPTEVEKLEYNEADKLMREGKGTPLSIDLDEAFKMNADDSVEKTFPSSKFDTKEGAKFGLGVMNDLIQTGNFYEKRDGSKDFELINTDDITSRMDAMFVSSIKADIEKEGRFEMIPTAMEDGTVGYTVEKEGGKQIPLTLSTMPVSTYNVPAIQVTDAGPAGDGLVVTGERTITWKTTTKKVAVQKVNYWVVAVPSGDGWSVTDIGWKTMSSKVSDAK